MANSPLIKQNPAQQ